MTECIKDTEIVKSKKPSNHGSNFMYDDEFLYLMINLSERIAALRYTWDNEDVDGEAVYLAIRDGIADSLREMIRDWRKIRNLNG